jgi:hypothetical protein
VRSFAAKSVEHTLSDVANRQLSAREEVRVGAAAITAVNKIWQRLIDGEEARTDGFFDSPSGGSFDRSPAEELFEGSMLKCKNEHEEKKLQLIAEIPVIVAFDAQVSSALANQVLLTAERLSYRQLCMVAVIGRHAKLGFDTTRWNSSALMHFENGRDRGKKPGELSAFYNELYALSPSRENLLTYSRREVTSHGSEKGALTEFGGICFRLMGLDEIPEDELRDLMTKYESWLRG